MDGNKKLGIIITIPILFTSLMVYLTKLDDIKHERLNAAQPVYEIDGTSITFQEWQFSYRCYAGVTYLAPGYRRQAVVLLDDNNKPRTCRMIKNVKNL